MIDEEWPLVVVKYFG